jgi:ligand-binding sensor domain-containing protein
MLIRLLIKTCIALVVVCTSLFNGNAQPLPTSCLTISTAATATLRDRADVSQPYTDDLDCYWLIKPAGARQILLRFDRFDLEDGFDFLTVYAGSDTTRIVGVFTGATLPQQFVVEDSAVVMRFTTDDSEAGNGSGALTGWSLQYLSLQRLTTLRVDTDRLDFGVYPLGQESRAAEFRVSGANFLEDVTVVAPRGFKVALSPGSVFQDTIRIPVEKGTNEPLRRTFFVHFSAVVAGQVISRLQLFSGAAQTSVPLTGLAKPSIFWESSNGPFSGRVQTMAVAPGNVLLAGTRSGVYRSNSNGAVWLQTNGATPAGGLNTKAAQNVFAMATSPRLAYVATDAGLFRSLDTGKTWEKVPANGLDKNVHALIIFGGRAYAGTENGLFRYAADTRSWTRLTRGLPSDDVSVYALAGLDGRLYAGTADGGAYVSLDSGSTWFATNGEGRGQELLAGDGDVVEVFAAGDGRLVALVNTYDDDDKLEETNLYTTTNQGGSWANETLGDFADFDGFAINSMVISNETLYIGTSYGVFKRAFGATTWTQTNRGLTEPTVIALIASGSTLYAGTLGGFFRSTNQGTTWTAINTGLTASLVYDLYEQRGTVLAATEGSGVFRSTDNGTTWTQANNGLPGRYIGGFAGSAEVVFAASYDDVRANGVYKSLDNGASWAATGKFPESNSVTRPLSPQPGVLVVGYDDQNVLYAGSSEGRVYASADGGTSWRDCRLPTQAEEYDVYATGDAPGRGVYIGTLGAGVYTTTNGLTVNPHQWRRILFESDREGADSVRTFVTFRGVVYAGTDGGLFRLNAAQTRWLKIEGTTRLTEASILSLAIAGDMLYAGTFESGVWRSADGITWERVADGFLSNTDVYALESDGINLYAGLNGNAIFRTSLRQAAGIARAYLEIDDFYTAAVGDSVELTLRMGNRFNLPDLPAAQMPTVTGFLRFNASLLDREEFRSEAVVNGERLVPLRFALKSDTQIKATRDSTVWRMKFRALLGNSVATPLTLTNLTSNGVSFLTRRPGLFTLKGLSDAGGTRLFVAESKPLLAVLPNPAQSDIAIKLETFESGATTITLSNVYGQTLKTLLARDVLPGEYDVHTIVGDLPQGAYFLTVQTPTHRVTKQVRVVR